MKKILFITLSVFTLNLSAQKNLLVGSGSGGGSIDTMPLSLRLNGKQSTLISGTNIKSINSQSLLGSGDLSIAGGSGVPFIKGVYFASLFGLHGDGVTDETTLFQTMIDSVGKLGGGDIYFDAATYLIAGPLVETWGDGSSLNGPFGANAQIRLPVNPLSNPMLVITLRGAVHPLISHFVWNGDPLRNATVFKSTLTNPTNNVLAAVFAGTSYNETNVEPNQNHVQLNLINLICEAPYDPAFTFFNLKYQMANRVENVIIYGGSTSLAAACYANAPTHAYAYGIKLPDENHTPNNIMENVRIMGFYNGMQMSECVNANGVRISGVYRGVVCVFGFHISVFRDLHVYWSPYGIVAEASRGDNKNRLRILGYGIEHKGVSGGAAWMANIADVYDPNNYLVGDLVFVSVKGGVGNTPTDFVKNGGSTFHCTSLEDKGAGL